MNHPSLLGGRSFSLISNALPLCKVAGYHHLGIAISSPPTSIDFFSKLGFHTDSSLSSETITVVSKSNGFHLRLFLSDVVPSDGQNILMDNPTEKYPGINHASFGVPNVPLAESFLKSQGIGISGTRGYPGDDRVYAVFARDPDRTTFEFERNVGDPIEVAFSSEHIGYDKPIDHVGIRVSNPDLSMKWYAETLGFRHQVMRYPLDANPLKNMSPWIPRTDSDCDVNLILNCNTHPAENVLIAGGLLRPGIIYAAFTVDSSSGSIDEVAMRLLQAGVTAIRETEVSASSLRVLSKCALPSDNSLSLYVLDPDGSVIRLMF